MDAVALEELRRACTALLWGTAIIIADFTIAGFDLINDTIGTVVVLVGVGGLRRVAGEAGAAPFAEAAWWLAIVAVPASIVDQVGGMAFSGVWQWSGTVMAALAFRQIATDHGWTQLASGWRANAISVAILGGIPTLIGVVFLAVNGGDEVYVETPLAAIPLLIGLAVVIHLLVMLGRTRRMASGGAPELSTAGS